MISVLMAIYDEPSEVYQRALASIGAQTLQPAQIVLINDNPKRRIDESEIEAVLGIATIDIVVINNSRNRGLGYSLNEGLKKCNHQFIARMDADDESLPTRFEEQQAWLEQHPDVDFLFCGVFDSSRSITECDRKTGQELSFEKHFFVCFPFRHATLFARAEPYKQLGYQDYTRSQDWDLYFRAKYIGIKEGYLETKLYRVNKFDKYDFRDKPMHLRRMARGHLLHAWLLTKNILMLSRWNGFWGEYRLCIRRLPKMTAILGLSFFK